MFIKSNDKVKVIAGRTKVKKALLSKRFSQQNDRVIVKGVNIVKKHQKPNNANPNGGIVEMEAPIHVSNVKKISE